MLPAPGEDDPVLVDRRGPVTGPALADGYQETLDHLEDYGFLRVFDDLGIEVCQDHRGITLKQDRYARKIMEECGMAACNSVSTPMDVNVKLSRSAEEKSINERDYRRSIGCLRYLLHTRPDLAFSVGVLRRYMHDPKQSHGAALKQVMRYMRGTLSLSLGLIYTRSEQIKLIGFSDASHNVDVDDGRSTT